MIMATDCFYGLIQAVILLEKRTKLWRQTKPSLTYIEVGNGDNFKELILEINRMQLLSSVLSAE